MSAEGWLYDGETAVRRPVRVEADGRALRLSFADDRPDSTQVAALAHVETRGTTEVYGRTDLPGWRLGIVEPGPELRALLPGQQRYGRWIDRVGLVPAILIGVVVSAAILFAGNKSPEWLAPLVPRQWEERFGDTLVGDFGGKGCRSPEGEAALAALAGQLSPGAKAINIRVVDIPIVNAAALPGGNIVIFDRLIDEAKGPDEVAGVLAHEIAHVEERHVTESMIRAMGFGVIVSALGGSTGANVESLIAAGYSRDAEREADAAAIASLRRAGISPIPTAGFFERLGKVEGRMKAVARGLSYVSTHPMSGERQAAFRASAVPDGRYRPALSPEQWKALRNICRPYVGPKGDIVVTGRR